MTQTNNLSDDEKAVAKEKFQEIQGLFKRLSHEMFEVVESYHIWATLVFSRSILEVGNEIYTKEGIVTLATPVGVDVDLPVILTC